MAMADPYIADTAHNVTVIFHCMCIVESYNVLQMVPMPDLWQQRVCGAFEIAVPDNWRGSF